MLKEGRGGSKLFENVKITSTSKLQNGKMTRVEIFPKTAFSQYFFGTEADFELEINKMSQI